MDFVIALAVSVVWVFITLVIMIAAFAYLRMRLMLGTWLANLSIGVATIFHTIGKASTWIWLPVIFIGVGFVIPIAGLVSFMFSEICALLDD